MVTRTDIRIRNLMRLIAEADGSQAELARRSATSRTYISQVLHGYEGDTGKSRSVGDRLARKLEKGMGKPIGWMDRDHGAVSEGKPEPNTVQTGGWVSVVGTIRPNESGYWAEWASVDLGWLNVPTDDPAAYGLRVKGAAYAPTIRDGWYIVVEPSKPLEAGEFVLVALRDGSKLIGELLYERSETLSLASLRTDSRELFERDEIEEASYVGLIVSPSKLMPA